MIESAFSSQLFQQKVFSCNHETLEMVEVKFDLVLTVKFEYTFYGFFISLFSQYIHQAEQIDRVGIFIEKV